MGNSVGSRVVGADVGLLVVGADVGNAVVGLVGGCCLGLKILSFFVKNEGFYQNYKAPEVFIFCSK